MISCRLQSVTDIHIDIRHNQLYKYLINTGSKLVSNIDNVIDVSNISSLSNLFFITPTTVQEVINTINGKKK